MWRWSACVCVCNPTPQIEATNRGKCSCLTSNMHHFLPPLCLGFVGSSYMPPFVSWSFSPSPDHPFFFSPVFMHQCVHLSITQSQPAINWFVSRKSFFAFSADYCQCMCHLQCMSQWSMECVFFFVCVWHQWSHLAEFYVLDIRGSGLLCPNQWLQSLVVYSFIT